MSFQNSNSEFCWCTAAITQSHYCISFFEHEEEKCKSAAHIHIVTHTAPSHIFLMIADDDYYAEEGFNNYVPSTTDPGPWMLFGVCIYSLCCIVCLPICVLFANKRRKSRQHRSEERNVDLHIDKVVSKTISPILEEKVDTDDNDENSMSCVIDLSGEGTLKNANKSNKQDIKKKCNSILQVRDLDTLTTEVSVFKVKCA